MRGGTWGVHNLPIFVLHQGTCTDTTVMDGRYMMRNNYEYSKRLLLYSLERGTRLIYASSAAVYGKSRSARSPSTPTP